MEILNKVESYSILYVIYFDICYRNCMLKAFTRGHNKAQQQLMTMADTF